MFKTEKDLVLEIKKNLVKKKVIKSLFSSSRKSKIYEELNLGYGIPDVVVVQYNSKYKKRKEFLNYFDISILSLINKKGDTSVEEIIFLTQSREKKIYSSLAVLESEELIIMRDGKYSSHKKYSEVLEGCIAIEAKLKNWKRALEQAYRYKWFSNKSFVILPEENINPALKNLDLFKKYGVGLASINEKNEIQPHYTPNYTEPYSKKMHTLLSEHLINDLNSY
jgi:hypothetical protein